MVENGNSSIEEIGTSPDEKGAAAEVDDRSGLGRRAILAGLTGLAGVAAVTVASGSTPAAATSGGGDQGSLAMGSNSYFRAPSTYTNTPNIASVATDIVASPNFGLYTIVAGYYVFRADARPGNSYAEGLQGYGAGGATGVHGFGGTTGTGVIGEGYAGLAGYGTEGDGVTGSTTNGSGVTANSTNGYGGVFSGGRAAMRLMPKAGAGAPTTGTHARGELVVDNTGVLFLCKTNGTPGTWVQIGETASSGTPAPAGPAFSLLPTPERFVDTRTSLGGVQGPVPAGTTSTYQMTARNGQSGNASLQIPGTATALVGNLTVLAGASAAGGYVTLWPQGDRPTTSSINFGPGSVVANSYTAGLAPDGKINVFAHQECHYILDVVGYYG